MTESMEYFVQQLQQTPKDAQLHRNVAALLLGQRRIDRALKHYEIAIQNDKTNPGISNDMGIALLKASASIDS